MFVQRLTSQVISQSLLATRAAAQSSQRRAAKHSTTTSRRPIAILSRFSVTAGTPTTARCLALMSGLQRIGPRGCIVQTVAALQT